MFTFKLIYLILIIASSIFFILYKDVLALLLLIVVLCIPVLLFISLLIMAFGVKIKAVCDKTVITTGDKAIITVKVSNFSFIPANQIKLYVRYKNSFFNSVDKSELPLSAKPFSKTLYNLEFESKHAGNVEIYLNISFSACVCILKACLKVSFAFSRSFTVFLISSKTSKSTRS